MGYFLHYELSELFRVFGDSRTSLGIDTDIDVVGISAFTVPAAAPAFPIGLRYVSGYNMFVGMNYRQAAALDNAATKKGLSLLWFSTGKDDGLITTTRGTVELLKKHGFKPVFIESEGAHTWLNWRDYLSQFAPQLFQPQDRQRTSAGR